MRQWESRDSAAVAAAARDEYIAPVWGLPAADEEEGAHRWLAAQSLIEDSGRGFSRALGIRGEPASGHVGLTLREDDRTSIYYWLVPGARGRGLAEHAVRMLAHWALTELSTARLEARVEPENAASRRLLSRLGFTEEGLLRSFALFGDRRADVVMYALLPGDDAAAALAP